MSELSAACCPPLPVYSDFLFREADEAGDGELGSKDHSVHLLLRVGGWKFLAAFLHSL